MQFIWKWEYVWSAFFDYQIFNEMAYKRFTRIKFTWLHVHLSIFIKEFLFDYLSIYSASAPTSPMYVNHIQYAIESNHI